MEIRYSYRGVPTLKRFSQSNAFLRAVKGPIGSGKSSACVIEILKRAGQQAPGPDGIRRSRWVCIRQTYPQLRDTTIKTFFQWCPPERFGTYRQSDNVYNIEAFEGTHVEVWFRALDRLDHVNNLLSMELTGGWINEVKDVVWPVVDALQGRVGRFPAKKDGGATWSGVFMDTNPPDSDSRFFKFWEDQKHNPDFAEIFHQPSGLSPEAENLENLPKDYYTRIAGGKDPERVKVFVRGEYGFISDGRQVYTEYNDAAHCNPDIKPITYEPMYRGWDFGLTPCCVFVQMSPTGQLLVLDEMVSESMGIDQFSDEVIEYSSRKYPDLEFHDIGDPAGSQRAQTDEKSCFGILQAKGIDIEPGLQTMAIRLESVRKPLTRLVMGKPGFQIHPRCKVTRRGMMGGYCFRRLQTSTERYTHVPDKNNYSHIQDSLQYVCTRLFGGGLTSKQSSNDPDYRDTFDDYSRSDVTGY